MSYTIDVFRRRVRPANNLLQYSAFVSMFPHLIAGPIVRWADIEDQLRRLEPKLTAALAGHRALLLRDRAREEGRRRRLARAARRPPLRRARLARARLRLGGRPRLRAPALLRLLGLLGHGGRARVPARLPLPAELQLAVQGEEHLRLLAALAHDALVLAARLPLHPARRQPTRAAADAPQPRDHDGSSAASGTARRSRSSSGGCCTAPISSFTTSAEAPASRRAASP